MPRYYIIKDGAIQGDTPTRKAAIELIRIYQDMETHPFIQANFSIIKGEEEFIPYPAKKSKKEERP